MLINKIDEAIKDALKAGRSDELSVLRLIKAALKNEEIARKHTLSQQEEIAVLDKQAKQGEDAFLQYEKAGRADLAEKEKIELKIINNYRPAKMTEQEVRAQIKKVIAGSQSDDFGMLMKEAMSVLRGKADGGLVSRVVKEELEKK